MPAQTSEVAAAIAALEASDIRDRGGKVMSDDRTTVVVLGKQEGCFAGEEEEQDKAQRTRKWMMRTS